MNYYDIKDYREILRCVNPLGLRVNTDRVNIYPSPSECYLDCLKLLDTEFPRGFIDLPLFMAKYMKQPLLLAARKCCGKQYVLVNLWKEDDYRNEKIEDIMKVLLKTTKITLSRDSLDKAITYFDYWLATKKAKGEKHVEADVVMK